MGISGFYGQWVRHYKKYIKNVSPGIMMSLSIDHLMIDMNGLIHPVVNKYYEDKATKKTTKTTTKRTSKRQPVDEIDEILMKITDEIFKLTKIINPVKCLVLAIDGVAPIAKQMQQRKRRFGEVDSSSMIGNSTFDRSQISPGTDFMRRLSSHLNRWALENSTTYQVIVSDDLIPGEGEHKLMTYLRYYGNSRETYCIHANDADVINLCICNRRNTRRIYILRDNIQTWNCEKFAYNLLDMTGIADSWNESIITGRNPLEATSVKPLFNPAECDPRVDFSADFVNFLAIIGNDFLPSIIGQDTHATSLDNLIQMYRKIIPAKKLKSCDDSTTINTFKHLNILFSIMDSDLLPFLDTQKIENPKGWIDKSVVTISTKNGNVDKELFRQNYYELSFGKDFTEKQIETMCNNYIEGLYWMKYYYNHGVPSWTWFYNYNYSPLPGDLEKYSKTYKFTEFGRTLPIDPWLQLCMILNRNSIYNLLPFPLNNIPDDKRVTDYFPDTWITTWVTKYNQWDGVQLINRPRLDIVKQVYLELFRDLKVIKNRVLSNLYYNRVLYSIEL